MMLKGFKLLSQSTTTARQGLISSVQSMPMASGLKGDYFQKKANEVPDVTLPEDVDKPSAFADEAKSSMPPST